MARIDVAIPCYQYGHLLRQCVSSVLNQDLRDLRVLIIDNASTDNSVEVAQEMARNDPRIELVVHAKNLGPHASYNEAVDWASSEYFSLVDADDLLHEGALSHATQLLDGNQDAVMMYGRASYITTNGELHAGKQVHPDLDWEIVGGDEIIEEVCERPFNIIPSPTVVRRTSAQKKAGYYRTSLRYTDDMEMWLRIARLGSVARTGRAQAVQRFHPTQQTHRVLDSMVDDFVEREAAILSFFKNEGRDMPKSEQLIKLAKRSLGYHAYWSAFSQLLKGHLDLAGLKSIFSFVWDRSPRALLFPPILWAYKYKNQHRQFKFTPRQKQRMKVLTNSAEPAPFQKQLG